MSKSWLHLGSIRVIEASRNRRAIPAGVQLSIRVSSATARGFRAMKEKRRRDRPGHTAPSPAAHQWRLDRHTIGQQVAFGAKSLVAPRLLDTDVDTKAEPLVASATDPTVGLDRRLGRCPRTSTRANPRAAVAGDILNVPVDDAQITRPIIPAAIVIDPPRSARRAWRPVA